MSKEKITKRKRKDVCICKDHFFHENCDDNCKDCRGELFK